MKAVGIVGKISIGVLFMIGLPSGTVKIVPYTEEWERLFEDERRLLWSVIGNYVIDIQHVGSTSIPGLASKPVIDIAVFVTSLKVGEKCITPLEEAGYEFRQDGGILGRYFFAKSSKENRTHNLHVEEMNGEFWENHILFRDYLRKHKEDVIEYADLKLELALKYENDRDSYASGKDDFIKRILKKAKNEKRF